MRCYNPIFRYFLCGLAPAMSDRLVFSGGWMSFGGMIGHSNAGPLPAARKIFMRMA